MEFRITDRNRHASAFTLLEMLISVLLGTLLLLGLMSFYGFSLSSFASMTNYADLNNQSRNASDLLSRDIRAATSVASAINNQLILHASDGTNISYIFDASSGTLSRYKGGDSR